jgi:hypothetical protein
MAFVVAARSIEAVLDDHQDFHSGFNELSSVQSENNSRLLVGTS